MDNQDLRQWIEVLRITREKLFDWEASMNQYQSVQVDSGPVFENVMDGDSVSLWVFPVPNYNTQDGGRHIGASDAVILRDTAEQVTLISVIFRSDPE